MTDPDRRPAYYAARPGAWRDWWTLLHPPYTAWHLSYVVMGASLAPHLDALRLAATLLAFFAAVGIAAHALDELHGRPLRTQISNGALLTATGFGLFVACGLGAVGVTRVGLVLVPFIVTGPVLVVAYNAELFGGIVHTDVGFALSWGAFPLLVGYVAQTSRVSIAAVLAASGASALSYAQRTLSRPARLLRRQVERVSGSITLVDGTIRPLDSSTLRAPLEQALRAMSWGLIAFAAAFAVARLF